jgi:AmiR/NasT family two-component response regulator
MISAFVVAPRAADHPDLPGDLLSAGVNVVGESASRCFVQEVIRSAADVVVCYEKHPDDALFTNLTTLAASAPRPVLVFTCDPDAGKIEQSLLAGIHVYAIDGYAPNRLRALIHVAQARFRHEQRLRAELAEINNRFDERKLIDRAKGILMRARQIPEEEAYRALRSAAMQSKQRLGQVSQHVIHAALYGDAVNRAGQLRMLSQRLVKLHALRAMEFAPTGVAAQLEDAAARIDENIGILRRGLSPPTFGDLIDSVATPWARLKLAAGEPASRARLPEIDALAGALLDNAERLTANLETAGLATKLRVINVSGRQRMLAQKMAKLALLPGLIEDPAARPAPGSMEAAMTAFSEGIDYLKSIPLSTPEIRRDLAQASELWLGFQAALPDSGPFREQAGQGQAMVAALSDELAERFDRLTGQYERGMQMLLE